MSYLVSIEARQHEGHMTYHYFSTKALAEMFLSLRRLEGYTGFILGETCGAHEVRIWKGGL